MKFRPKITHGKCGKEEGFWWVVDYSAVLFLAPFWCRGRGFLLFRLKKIGVYYANFDGFT